MKKILILLSCCFIYVFGNQEIKLVKGQAIFLEFDKKNFIELKNQNQIIPTFIHPRNKNKILAIFALPYKNPPKSTKLIAIYKNKQQEIIITALEGNYKSEQIQVAKNKIFPPKNVQDRIKKEFKEANNIYTSYTSKPLYDGTFSIPLASFITSDFGKARIFNHKISSYHSGIDFRAISGTPVYATNSGIVKIAKNRYYAGNSVVIDHSLGIYSQYYHLSKINVKNGQKIKKGDLIGLSGATGRVSGPHLHFGILVAQKQVDPLDFIKKFNALFDEI